jgi:imidazole glycerol-phosphate synthase subunit HisH
MIAILDYEVGNVSSIANMFKKAGVDALITNDKAQIINADKIILPGVGHFDFCMEQLQKAVFYETLLKEVLENKKPVLGICVGCQMLMESSEEGNKKGLGWIKGKVVKFKKEKMPPNYTVPHMAWCDVIPADDAVLYKGISEPRFYFAHSYHVACADKKSQTATASYGYDFAASVEFENVTGVQFHPEKSHSFGMQLYTNYANSK